MKAINFYTLPSGNSWHLDTFLNNKNFELSKRNKDLSSIYLPEYNVLIVKGNGKYHSTIEHMTGIKTIDINKVVIK